MPKKYIKRPIPVEVWTWPEFINYARERTDATGGKGDMPLGFWFKNFRYMTYDGNGGYEFTAIEGHKTKMTHQDVLIVTREPLNNLEYAYPIRQLIFRQTYQEVKRDSVNDEGLDSFSVNKEKE